MGETGERNSFMGFHGAYLINMDMESERDSEFLLNLGTGFNTWNMKRWSQH